MYRMMTDERASCPPEDDRSPHAAPLNDCRALHDCMVPPVAARPVALPTLPLRPHPDLRLLPVDDEHMVAFVPSRSRVALLNRATQALLARLPLEHAPPEAAAALANLGRLGLLAGPDPALAAADTLVAWLHLSDACNLRCSYCYLAKSGEQMDAVTGRAAVDAVLRSAKRHAYRHVLLKYAGGEALLNLATVEQVHQYALEQAAAHGLVVEAGVLSNGTTLSTRHCARLAQLGLRLMVSLDGLGAAHDEQRPASDGGASALAAQRGIERAMAAGLRPEIAVTVSARNLAALPGLVAWLLEHKLRFSLSFYRDNAQSADVEGLACADAMLISGMRAVYAEVARRPPPWSVLGALLDRMDLSAPHQRACGVGDNYLVIDQRGRVAKCQMALDQPVGSIHAPDPLALIRADQIGVVSPTVAERPDCAGCDWRHWCAGGCAALTRQAGLGPTARSPFCAVYRALSPELLLLEGRRLLFWERRSSSAQASAAD